jgi:hypothetical protein
MAAYIALSGEPFCADCRYSLRGSPIRGRCPECGGHYYLNLPEPRPGFLGLNRGWSLVTIVFGAAALDRAGIRVFDVRLGLFGR